MVSAVARSSMNHTSIMVHYRRDLKSFFCDPCALVPLLGASAGLADTACAREDHVIFCTSRVSESGTDLATAETIQDLKAMLVSVRSA